MPNIKISWHNSAAQALNAVRHLDVGCRAADQYEPIVTLLLKQDGFPSLISANSQDVLPDLNWRWGSADFRN